MKKLLQRKQNRLSGYNYSQNGSYFVTICAKDRAELFSVVVGATIPGRPCTVRGHPRIQLTEIGHIIETAILQTNRDNVIIDCYVIMPNHVHMIVHIESFDDELPSLCVSPKTDDTKRSPLQTIIRNMKAYITKQIGFSPWQKSFHDHIIRNEADYRRIIEYIQNNPDNWEQDCFYPAIGM